jgi:hypothetical protein
MIPEIICRSNEAMKILNKHRFVILIVISLYFSIGTISDLWGACPISLIPGQVDDSLFIKWNPDNSEVINKNQSLELKISGKCPNYTWKLRGNGFWFDEGHTISELETGEDTVTLYADGSSCGSAVIEVTDTCNKTLVGQIRSSTGEWKGCATPDTGKVGNWMAGSTQRKTWVAGKFQWLHWNMRCCKNDADRANNGCSWGQCLGEGLAQTTVCADDIGSISCTFGICWEGSSDHEPGHIRYWGCP